jgi:ABC-2 type transport system ATP-binding protein
MTSPTVLVDRLVVERGGVLAVNDVTSSLNPGEVTGLLGPSGGGKTTLMRAIVGVQRLTSGSVTVLGATAGSTSLRHRLGYVTQAPSVYDDLTIAENVGFFAKVLGLPSTEVERCLAMVDLSEYAGRRVDRLSGGQRSRVSLAVALLGSPDLLVLDEPTVGLDPVLRRDLWAIFHTLADAGVTVLVSSHVMDEAERCDRLMLMREGHLISQDSPTELLARTDTSTIEAAFLALVEGGDR